MGNSNFESGKMGEYICAVALMRLGESVEIVNLDTVDIIVNRNGSGLLRLQVKSSQYKDRNDKRAPGYQFFPNFGKSKTPLTKEHCDAIAFVALDIERVLFKSSTDLEPKITRRYPRTYFEVNDLERTTWKECIQ